jgi:hypothetical protein
VIRSVVVGLWRDEGGLLLPLGETGKNNEEGAGDFTRRGWGYGGSRCWRYGFGFGSWLFGLVFRRVEWAFGDGLWGLGCCHDACLVLLFDYSAFSDVFVCVCWGYSIAFGCLQ